jgi:hypothetical protein
VDTTGRSYHDLSAATSIDRRNERLPSLVELFFLYWFSTSPACIESVLLSDYDFVFAIDFLEFQSNLARPRQVDFLGDEIGGDGKFTPTAIDQHREMNSSRPA